MKRRWPFGAVLGLIVAGGSSAADLGECVKIKDDAVRLLCYDRVAGQAPATAGAATPTAPAASPAAIVVEPSTPPAPAAEPKRIESRIVGTFDGWRQGTKFKLENGQTWESIGTSTFNTRKTDAPPVVLERDFIGQMKLAVDGVQPRAAVRLVGD